MSESKFAKGEGWSIQYTVQGAGPALILLHGGGPGATGASNYSRNVAEFAKHFTTYLIDIPGWGQSSKNLQSFGSPSPFFNAARAVKAFMDVVGIDKAHLVGNSLGGAAAYCLAIEHPQRVDRFVSMGPGGAWVEGLGPSQGIIQLLTYYAGEGPTREKLKAFLLNLVYDTSVVTDALIEERFAASNQPDIIANPPLMLPKGGPPQREAYLSNDPRLKSIAHRSLLIWGQQDRVNQPAGAASFNVLAHQDVILFSNCGHWAQWEDAAKFNELVLWFLRRP